MSEVRNDLVSYRAWSEATQAMTPAGAKSMQDNLRRIIAARDAEIERLKDEVGELRHIIRMVHRLQTTFGVWCVEDWPKIRNAITAAAEGGEG